MKASATPENSIVNGDKRLKKKGERSLYRSEYAWHSARASIRDVLNETVLICL